MTIPSAVDFRKPRQKEWGIIKNNSLVQLNYDYVTDINGNAVSSYSTNCYESMLEQAKLIIAQGTGTANVQAVEFIPYDYLMQPRE